jgi:hypothetical protein
VKAELELSKHIRLPKDVKEKLDELRSLSEKAEAGDTDARKVLKEALLNSTPAVIARASDIGRKAQHMLINSAAHGNPLTEYALQSRLDLLRAELGGEEPSPLEALLAQRIAAAWMLNQLLEIYCSAQLWRGAPKGSRAPLSTTKFYIEWQERAHRQLMNSIKALAQVRRLSNNMPSFQVNTQVNLGGGRGSRGRVLRESQTE